MSKLRRRFSSRLPANPILLIQSLNSPHRVCASPAVTRGLVKPHHSSNCSTRCRGKSKPMNTDVDSMGEGVRMQNNSNLATFNWRIQSRTGFVVWFILLMAILLMSFAITRGGTPKQIPTDFGSMSPIAAPDARWTKLPRRFWTRVRIRGCTWKPWRMSRTSVCRREKNSIGSSMCESSPDLGTRNHWKERRTSARKAKADWRCSTRKAPRGHRGGGPENRSTGWGLDCARRKATVGAHRQ